MASYSDKQQPGGITFAAQDKLPKLPIPDLEGTTQKYLEALKPLQTSRERLETQHAVQEFLRNEGPDLQEKLKNYAQSKTSYIEQFCEFYLVLFIFYSPPLPLPFTLLLFYPLAP